MLLDKKIVSWFVYKKNPHFSISKGEGKFGEVDVETLLYWAFTMFKALC